MLVSCRDASASRQEEEETTKRARPQSMPALEALSQARSVHTARTRPIWARLLDGTEQVLFGLCSEERRGESVRGFPERRR